MSLARHLPELCDLLLGAAHADKRVVAREREKVRQLLKEQGGGALSKDLDARFAAFKPAAFDLAAAAAAFHGESEADRRKILELISSISDSDDEIDFREDDYTRAVAAALKLPADALEGLVVDVITSKPPPPPKK